jgi:hypothetical protein
LFEERRGAGAPDFLFRAVGQDENGLGARRLGQDDLAVFPKGGGDEPGDARFAARARDADPPRDSTSVTLEAQALPPEIDEEKSQASGADEQSPRGESPLPR